MRRPESADPRAPSRNLARMTQHVTAAAAIVDELAAAGVDHVFTVPGESFLGVLDELYDRPDIRVVTTRHEGGAAFMAEAYGALTRRPAVCAGTRAVGAGNLAIGIHTALQDSTPMVALLGQVSSAARGREAFQEADLEAMLGTMTVWAHEPTTAAGLGPAAREAGRRALAGRQGPTALIVREDLLAQPVAPQQAAPVLTERPRPTSAQVSQALTMLADAERPVLLVGLDVVASDATELAVAFAERHGLPVVGIWRRPDAFPNDHSHWVGQAGLSRLPCVADVLAEADVWFVVGDRLDENTLAGYSMPRPDTRLVHVHLGEPTGELPIRSGAREFLAAALDRPAPGVAPEPGTRHTERLERVARLRATWERQSTPPPPRAVAEGCVDHNLVVTELARVLTPETVVVLDAGNFTGWAARYLRLTKPGTFLAPISGAMGYAVPAAIGAKLARPDAPVLAIAGDGGFAMTAMELATAAAEGLDVTVVVLDNGEYGTIRMHQERSYPGRPVATALTSIDVATLADALGARGFTVTGPGDLADTLRAAMAYAGPSVVHIHSDPAQRAVAENDHR